jgi:hypothetical protein
MSTAQSQKRPPPPPWEEGAGSGDDSPEVTSESSRALRRPRRERTSLARP